MGLATEDCSSGPSTPLLESTHTSPTRVSWVPFPPSQRRRQPLPLVLARLTHSTLFADACRCNPRSRLRSTSTRAPDTASRRSLLRRASPLACTRDSWQMCCAVSVARSSSYSTTGLRICSASELRLSSYRSCSLYLDATRANAHRFGRRYQPDRTHRMCEAWACKRVRKKDNQGRSGTSSRTKMYNG